LTGATQWVRRGGSNIGSWDAGRGVGLDDAGNVYVTGQFVGPANFDGLTLTGSFQEQFFLAKYDSAGAIQWVRESAGGSSVYGTGLAVDPLGNSYAVGYADNDPQQAITFGSVTLTAASATGYSAFLVKHDSAGNVQWAHLIGGPGETYATKVAVDAAGNVYVRGSFSQSMTIGMTAICSLRSSILPAL
jgi:hypothetical protein